MPSQDFSRCNLKALIHLFSSSLCSQSAGPFSFLQIAEDCLAENTDRFITHFSLLFLFVPHVGFVTSLSAVSLPSPAVLGITYLMWFFLSFQNRGREDGEKKVHTEKEINQENSWRL